jgi:hypothetical protein
MPSSADRARSLVTGALRAFGRFWWDFLIGDTPELFVGGLVVLGLVTVLAREVSSTAAWLTLPALVIIALVTSVRRGAKGG